MNPMSIENEVTTLLQRLLDNDLTDSQFHQLTRLLVDEPQARHAYARFVHLLQEGLQPTRTMQTESPIHPMITKQRPGPKPKLLPAFTERPDRLPSATTATPTQG